MEKSRPAKRSYPLCATEDEVRKLQERGLLHRPAAGPGEVDPHSVGLDHFLAEFDPCSLVSEVHPYRSA